MIGHQSERESYTALRDVVARSARSWYNKTRQLLRGEQLLAGDSREEFWALQDINFEINAGDRVGIIGRNGAGKSTLLKILSRITEPSTGRVEINGRVASLLEVGTGFHPELSGRENIYLNGAILGMSRAEIRRKFDEIVAFAGVEKFLDTPVKRYSSGMYVRLAFAVAAHLEPEILVVDEVLAVGDAEFQKKCLGKMEDVSKNEGRTVLFVSHNMGAIQALCERAIFLSEGKIQIDATVEKTVEEYLTRLIPSGSAQSKLFPAYNQTKDFIIHSVEVLGKDNQPKGGFMGDESIKVVINFTSLLPIKGARIVFTLINHEGIIVFVSTNHKDLKSTIIAGGYTAECHIPANLLKKGTYIVRIHAGIPGQRVLLGPLDTHTIDILNSIGSGTDFQEFWPGIVNPALNWTLIKNDEL